VARRTCVTTWYARQFGKVAKAGSGRALAIARTVRAIANSAELPGHADFECSERPVARLGSTRRRSQPLDVVPVHC
jgi:hypothetical protein